MNGVVISGFGLSAFLFSTMAHVAFPGNTSDFLLILAVGTALPMVLGFFLVRPIPLPHSIVVEEEAFAPAEPPPPVVVASPALFRESSRAPLLPHHHAHHHGDADGDMLESEELIPGYTSGAHQHAVEVSDYFVPTNMGSVALSPTRGHERSRSRGAFSSRRPSARSYEVPLVDPEPPNVHGKGLFVDADFWVIFSITALRECHDCALLMQ